MSFSKPLVAKLNISFSILLLFIIQGCVYRIDRVKIIGDFEGVSKQYLFISRFDGDSLSLIDSILTNSKGLFSYSVDVQEPYLITLGLNRTETSITLLIEPGEEIRIHSKDLSLNDYRVNGSNGSALIHELTKRLKQTKFQIDSLKSLYLSNSESFKTDSVRSTLDSLAQGIITNHKIYTCNFIKDNTFSLASILALFQSYDSQNPVLDYGKDRKLFHLVDSTLLSVYSSNSLVQANHTRIQNLDSFNDRILKRDRMYKVGEVLPNIGYPLITGESLFYSNLWFRYILIDFQTQECEACKKNYLSLRKIYKEFAPKGLVVLQVTLGSSPDSVKALTARDSIAWFNASIPDMFNSKILDTLNINSVPANYITDRWGVVKSTNISGEKLRMKLKELLPN